MNRGMDLFKATVMEEILASQKFLVLLLEGIEEWARSVGKQVPAYKAVYQELIEQGVAFPVYSAAQVELNRLKAMKPQEVAAHMRAELEAQREVPEKVRSHMEVLREKREELTTTVSFATLNPSVMESLIACLEEIDFLLVLADTYQQAEKRPKVSQKQSVSVPVSVDRSAELLAKAMESWAALQEPGTASAPATLNSDNEDDLDVDLRPDLEYGGAVSPSLRQSKHFQTLKGRKSLNDEFVGDM